MATIAYIVDKFADAEPNPPHTAYQPTKPPRPNQVVFANANRELVIYISDKLRTIQTVYTVGGIYQDEYVFDMSAPDFNLDTFIKDMRQWLKWPK